ncbi:MAG: aromatic ring-hydroxylating dioxygenase subunit alpha [Pseudomonadota bacterium]
MLSQQAQEALAQYQTGYSLPASLYNDASVFEADTESLFLSGWFYACHISEIQNVGDFVVLNIANESVIVVRVSEDSVQAHLNVCRHRGSRVCLESHGNSKNFACPYHGWAYGLDGKLLVSKEMPAEFDKSAHGLKAAAVEIVFSMVFVNLDSNAGSLSKNAKRIEPQLSQYGFEQTKVAYQETWTVEANWKLVLENFMECYHCAPAHPEYACSHSLKLPDRLSEKLYAPLQKRSQELGINGEPVYSGETDDPLLAVFHHRQPLLDGYVTGTEDGKPVAPLLGSFAGYDGGAADIQLGLFFYGVMYPDHIVLYSFLPVDAKSSKMHIVWLVRDTAEQGRDYDVDKLTWLWRVTTDADKTIILNNQLGVNSRFYEPGPYSEMEKFTQMFVDWYVDELRDNRR